MEFSGFGNVSLLFIELVKAVIAMFRETACRNRCSPPLDVATLDCMSKFEPQAGLFSTKMRFLGIFGYRVALSQNMAEGGSRKGCYRDVGIVCHRLLS